MTNINDIPKIGSYRPKLSTMEAYAEMQLVAQNANETMLNVAKLLGYSCVYEWLSNVISDSKHRKEK